MHVGLFEVGGEDFDVTTATIDLLFVFDSELDHQAFALIAEGLKACRGSIEACILAGLQTLKKKKKHA